MGEEYESEPPMPGAVSMFKRRYDRRYCSHGCKQPLTKRAAKEHAKRAAALESQARALLKRAEGLRCGRW